MEETSRSLAELSGDFDTESIRIHDLRIVTSGRVAVAGAKMVARRKGTHQDTPLPAGIAVLVEQNGQWSLAASLPIGMDIVPGSARKQTDRNIE